LDKGRKMNAIRGVAAGLLLGAGICGSASAQMLPAANLPTLSIDATPAKHHHSDGVETAGQVVAIALPVIAGGISVYKDDWNGVGQLALVTAASVGTTYLLNHTVHEERPDHSDDHSFTSNTAALAFAPASYLWSRYGWQYGAPAYVAAAFVGYSRVDAKQHHWWDVAGSAAIAAGYDLLITSRYHVWRGNLQTGVSVTPDGAYVAAKYQF
jgi:membrane-associated phospholipid phosphatase